MRMIALLSVCLTLLVIIPLKRLIFVTRKYVLVWIRRLSQTTMEIVDSLETENVVTYYELEIYDVIGISHTQ